MRRHASIARLQACSVRCAGCCCKGTTMASTSEVKVPDIGDFKDVPVIEILVKVGDTVKPEDPLISLESDKATMDVPSPAAGTIKEIKLKVGDKVSEGSTILVLEGAGAAAGKGANGGAPAASASAANDGAAAPAAKPATASQPAQAKTGQPTPASAPA